MRTWNPEVDSGCGKVIAQRQPEEVTNFSKNNKVRIEIKHSIDFRGENRRKEQSIVRSERYMITRLNWRILETSWVKATEQHVLFVLPYDTSEKSNIGRKQDRIDNENADLLFFVVVEKRLQHYSAMLGVVIIDCHDYI